MAIAVFVESDNGVYKKSGFEALSYGKSLSSLLNTSCVAVSIGSKGSEDLGSYGADKHIHLNNTELIGFNPNAYGQALLKVVEEQNVETLILAQTYSGKSLAPLISVRMNAALCTGIVELPDISNGFIVKKSCFSNKAFAYVALNNQKKVLTLIPNSYPINELSKSTPVEETSVDLGKDAVNTQVLKTEKVSGKIVLTEAELVVSAGRGLKGPENWGMIEELAEIIGAATACSKPVADMDWRPHNEHVGQTGITIKPNLYIAIGISGAIQHLAGVASSKVICVINTDPEAPFFKAADYGIVGDAFEVVPKLIKRAKEIKGIT